MLKAQEFIPTSPLAREVALIESDPAVAIIDNEVQPKNCLAWFKRVRLLNPEPQPAVAKRRGPVEYSLLYQTFGEAFLNTWSN